jgi:hypothetical protein
MYTGGPGGLADYKVRLKFPPLVAMKVLFRIFKGRGGGGGGSAGEMSPPRA